MRRVSGVMRENNCRVLVFVLLGSAATFITGACLVEMANRLKHQLEYDHILTTCTVRGGPRGPFCRHYHPNEKGVISTASGSCAGHQCFYEVSIVETSGISENMTFPANDPHLWEAPALVECEIAESSDSVDFSHCKCPPTYEPCYAVENTYNGEIIGVTHETLLPSKKVGTRNWIIIVVLATCAFWCCCGFSIAAAMSQKAGTSSAEFGRNNPYEGYPQQSQFAPLPTQSSFAPLPTQAGNLQAAYAAISQNPLLRT